MLLLCGVVCCGDPQLVGEVSTELSSDQGGADSDAVSRVSPRDGGEGGDTGPDTAPEVRAAPDAQLDVATACTPSCDEVPNRLSATRYPLVLVHGAGGWDSLGSLHYFWGVAEALEVYGYGVYTAQVDPFNGSSIRATQLAAFVDAVLACTCAHKVNLLGHSQGGVDARYLISTLGYGDRVASLTTVATPHRGTLVADVVEGLVPGFSDDLVDFILFFVGDVLNDPLDDPSFRAQMQTLTTSGMAQFNIDTPNDDRVAYYSWAGRAGLTELGLEECADGEVPNPVAEAHPMFGLLLPLWGLMGGPSGVANDGLVAVESAKWGRFRGCVAADHLAQIGHPLSFTSGFDHLTFFAEALYFLESEGF